MKLEQKNSNEEEKVMSDNPNTRYVHVFRDGEWKKDIEFLDMNVGDVFRMFESCGAKVGDDKGSFEFEVKEKPFVRKDGVESVKADPVVCPGKGKEA